MMIMLMLSLSLAVSCRNGETTGQQEDERTGEQAAAREGIGGRFRKSKIDAAKLLVEQVVAKLEMYQLDVGNYPSEDEGGVNALVTRPKGDESLAAKWAGPYIKRKQLMDPWGNELGYLPAEKDEGDTTRQVVLVWSFGPNGRDETGRGDDIKSWEE